MKHVFKALGILVLLVPISTTVTATPIDFSHGSELTFDSADDLFAGSSNLSAINNRVAETINADFEHDGGPAPEILVLLSLGLVAFGLARRKSKRSSGTII